MLNFPPNVHLLLMGKTHSYICEAFLTKCVNALIYNINLKMIVSMHYQMFNEWETNHYLKPSLMLDNHYFIAINYHSVYIIPTSISPTTSALPGLHQTEGWEMRGSCIGYGGQCQILKSDMEGWSKKCLGSGRGILHP